VAIKHFNLVVAEIVGRHQGWNADVNDLLQGVFTRSGGDAWVQSLDGLAQSKGQYHLAVVGTLWGGAVVRDVGAAVNGIAQL